MHRLRLLGCLLALLLVGTGCVAGRASSGALDSPDAIEARLDRALVELRAPNPEATLADLEKLSRELRTRLEKSPEDGRLHALLARTAFYLRQEEQAKAAAERAIALAPDLPEPHYIRAFFLGARGQAEAALADALRATELDARQGRYWQLLGTLYLQLQKTAEARGAIDKALALEPRNAQALFFLGMLAMEEGKPEEALEAYEKAAELQPDDWRTRARLVQCHQALGNKEKRDAERESLLRLRRAGKVDQEYFVREQFQEGGRKVMVVENFELKDDWARRYEFQVYEPGTDKPAFVISLGSYSYVNALVRKENASGPRMFHLDAYYPGNVHETYGFYEGEPSYEETRELVLSILRGERKPISGTTPPKK